MSDEQDGCERVNVSFGTSLPGSPGQKAVKRLCVCVFHKKWQQTQILSNLEGFSIFFALEDSVKHYCQKTSD